MKACPPQGIPALDEQTLLKLDRPGPRYTSYPTVPAWSERFGAQEYVQALEAAGRDRDTPLSLYVHIPFCRDRCSFCACNVVIAPDARAAEPYLDLVEREIELVAARLGERRRYSRLHWGGGTPTFLTERQMERLAGSLHRAFAPTLGAEVAVEIDPSATRRDQLACLRALGFNRLSMGIQDFDAKVQEAIARIQPYEETRALLEESRALGFASINVDLIYGLPHQSPWSWAATLDRVASLRPDRIAVFSFASVPRLHPHQRKLSEAALPRGRAKLDLLRQAWEVFVAEGYRPIGMDHFARPEDPLSRAVEERTLSRDFQGYTVRRAPDTVGLGVTAIGRIGGVYVQNVRSRTQYRERLERGELPVERGMRLSTEDHRRAEVITEIMCNFRVDLGPLPDAAWAPELARLRVLERDGLLELRGSEVVLTSLGRVFVRNVAMTFDAYLAAPAPGKPPSFSRTV